jgi:hypothetical protein
VDKNPAYPAAVKALKAEGILPRRVLLRQCKYLNNVIEQDHRTVKKRTWLTKGVRLVSKGLANSRRNRNREHDPQGPSQMGSKGRRCCGSTVHRHAFRYRCLTFPSPSQLSYASASVGSKLRNETLSTEFVSGNGHGVGHFLAAALRHYGRDADISIPTALA